MANVDANGVVTSGMTSGSISMTRSDMTPVVPGGASVKYYLMEGETNLAPAVTWVSPGVADLTGALYSGPGVLVLATIHVACIWS